MWVRLHLGAVHSEIIEMQAQLVGQEARSARFRKLGFLDYGESGLQVHRSLLNVVLHD